MEGVSGRKEEGMFGEGDAKGEEEEEEEERARRSISE